MGRLRWRWLAFGELVDKLALSKGGRKWALVAATAGSGVGLHLLGAQLHELIVRGGSWEDAAWCLAFFLVFALFLWWLARQMRQLLGGQLRVHGDPKKSCRALVLFLSPPIGLEKRWDEPDFEDLNADGIVDAFEGKPWQQALRALRAHLERFSKGELREVYTITSSDRPEYEKEIDPKKRARLRGTYHYFADFERTALELALRCGGGFRVHHMASLGTRWQHGVDFESASELLDAVTAVYEDLLHKKVRDLDILIDITGGSSLCSAVGAAVALDENRRFQYVSQFSGEVLPYDVDYVPDARV